jgi:flagellar hook-basal body complex protein FliE
VNVPSVGFTSGSSGVGPTQPVQPVQKSEKGFGELVTDLLQDANQSHVQADTNIQNLMTGETDNVDDVVMSVVQADLAFRMVLEIRNRLISSYQEVMRMQV